MMTKCACRVLASFLLFFTIAATAQTAKLLPGEADTLMVFRKAGPYVVNVHRLKNVLTAYWGQKRVSVGTGSGIVWGTNGLIVTNYHVVGRHKGLAITLKNGKRLRAKMIGGDPRKDVAVLKVDDLKTLHEQIGNKGLGLANSDHLEVGQTAIAIGNPFGLSQTLTEGVVSAINREIPGFGGVTIAGMIQTDASINPGNSGGPLLDSSAQLIGMNTMIFSRSGTSSGIGFAIPVNTIENIVMQIIEHGKVIQPGIGIIPASDSVAFQMGIKGVIIAKVMPGSPAAKVGLKGVHKNMFGRLSLGDIIVAIDGKPTADFNTFFKVIDKKKVGQSVQLKVRRGSRIFSVDVKTVNVQ